MIDTQPGIQQTNVTALPCLDEIYRNECSYVWNSLRRLGVQERELDDLVHDTFFIVHRKLDTFDQERPIRPWLYGIALRVASDYRKSARNRREVLTAVPPQLNVSNSRPDMEIASKKNRELVLEALEALDFKNRTIFVMHDINEHTMAEAALELDIPLPTLYSRLRVARQQFSTAVHRIQRNRGMR